MWLLSARCRHWESVSINQPRLDSTPSREACLSRLGDCLPSTPPRSHSEWVHHVGLNGNPILSQWAESNQRMSGIHWYTCLKYFLYKCAQTTVVREIVKLATNVHITHLQRIRTALWVPYELIRKCTKPHGPLRPDKKFGSYYIWALIQVYKHFSEVNFEFSTSLFIKIKKTFRLIV